MRNRARKRAWKFIDLHPFHIHGPPRRSRPFARRTVEMTPDGTCFTHDARIDGIGKKRARDYTGGLKSAASVNREFYHGRVLSLENCPTNLIATRESRYSREHSRVRIREQTRKMSACEKIVSRLFPPWIFSIEFVQSKSSKMEWESRVLFRSNIAKCVKAIFLCSSHILLHNIILIAVSHHLEFFDNFWEYFYLTAT